MSSMRVLVVALSGCLLFSACGGEDDYLIDGLNGKAEFEDSKQVVSFELGDPGKTVHIQDRILKVVLPNIESGYSMWVDVNEHKECPLIRGKREWDDYLVAYCAEFALNECAEDLSYDVIITSKKFLDEKYRLTIEY